MVFVIIFRNNFMEAPTKKEKMPGEIKTIFEQNVKREIANFLTGEKYEMLGGQEMTFTEEDIKKIVEICNQPSVYANLFSKMCDGKPYSEENAKWFINFVKEGWAKQTNFVFIIRKLDSEIIGAIDIKSANLDRAEIGYWADENYSGFMTNTVNELLSVAKEVGFVKLFAGVLAGNDKSIKVLERSGFIRTKEEIKDNEPHFEYEREI